MSLDGLRVNHAGLDQAATDLGTTVKNIDDRLNRLESELAPLRSDWTGAASLSYQQAKAKWDQGMADMKALLAEIGTAVSTSNSDYQSTENQNQSRWG